MEEKTVRIMARTALAVIFILGVVILAVNGRGGCENIGGMR